jgi:hypothetical protein
LKENLFCEGSFEQKRCAIDIVRLNGERVGERKEEEGKNE